jgi:hypothetical protein
MVKNKLSLWLAFLYFFLISPLLSANTETEVIVYSHILTARGTSFPGSDLCHNGQYIFFKTRNNCAKHWVDERCNSLRITPIRQLEIVNLDGGQKVSRLHRLDLEYAVYLYDRQDSGDGFYNLFLKNKTTLQLETCKNQKIEAPKVIKTERHSISHREEEFLGRLYRWGHNIISTLPGEITNFSEIDWASPSLNTQQIKQELRERNISSPQCNDEISDDVLHQMGGEFSGSGLHHAVFDFVSAESRQIRPVYVDGTGQSYDGVVCEESVEL